jgi:hypothetical protein
MNWMPLSRWAADCTASVLGRPVAQYIARQRDRLALSATPLPERSKLLLRPYFSDGDLDRVRVLRADPLPIPDPPFYPLLRRLRLDFPEPRLVAAITLDSVVATREEMTARLLFHELVHFVQFRVLGLGTFSRLYVKGFLKHGSYDNIPLEVCAFELEHRFANQRRHFNVADEVSEWARRGLF